MRQLIFSLFLLLVLGPAVSQAQNGDCHFSTIPPGERDDFALVFQSVIGSVYCSKFESVPDDTYFRLYLGSVYRGIFLECGETANDMPLQVAYYSFPILRQMMQNPGMAIEMGLNMYADFFENLNTIGVGEILRQREGLGENGVYLTAGVDDGRMIAKELGCRSVSVRVLKKRLMELFTARQNIDPGEPSAELINSLMHPEWRNALNGQTPR